ncbi:MBOAT family protein [Helicobacter canis]|uniref:Alginate O- acetylation protein n=1 Tax=Helicobacter canis TaxID=29419 RepID=A0A377J390_9HELI|nr:MBOAT family O-acyltransferase [Helicobacter canis]STO96967.1 alginate O- acetylation protein [Helicobacter canis]
MVWLGGFCVVETGGGGKLSKDSACGLESAIASSRGVDRPQVLSSLRDLQNANSSSTILESHSSNESHKTRRSRSFFSKSTASDFKLESTFLQSRDSKSNAYFLSLRALLRKAWQSINKKVDSNFEVMDCHATATALARNDAENAASKNADSSTATTLNEQPKDSRISIHNAQNVFDKNSQAEGFCDEKAGLCSGEQGDKTCGLSTQGATNSLLFRAKQAKRSFFRKQAKRCERELAGFFRKPTPKPNQAQSSKKLNHPKALLILGIIFNLCLLGIFKYTDFFLENFNLFTKLLALDFAIPLPHILLPLALSFVTFQQIAFLVDCYKQATERESAPESSNPTQEIPYTNFLDYCLFITFFPQLIAGPIVHHKEMMPQFHAMGRRASVLGEHSPKSSHSPTAIPKILEEKQAECEKSPFLSLRADLSARQSTQTQTQNLESTFDKTQMDCHATAAALARNDAENTASKKVDSSVDCHATAAALARNDRNNATFGKVDSNLEAENVKNTAQDSRICYEKSLLCEPRKEIRLECLSRELGDAIKDLSRKTSEAVQGEAEAGFFSKAESSKKTESLQMQKPTPSIINWEYIAKGLFIFSIGLFKKVVIADSFAKWANAGFSAVENGAVLNCLESWATSLSYTFELYFDFSGYCDMAIGLGLLFGIILPINFSSPYKALNIAEFWRKWHITLGRFLKEYLYIPLGGNQNIKRVVSLTQNGDYSGDSALISIQGKSLESPCKAPFLAQRYCREPAPQKKESWLNNLLTLRNLFIVAFLSGVWHGAGWGFVIWGSLHGLAMVVHRGYMLLYKKLDSRVVYARFMQSKAYILLCWLLTFNFVNIAWVFFRAENVQGAINLLKGMFGGEVVWLRLTDSGTVSTNSIEVWGWIFLAFILALACKNSIALSTHISRVGVIFAGVGCAICLLKIIGDRGASSPFLYFNF